MVKVVRWAGIGGWGSREAAAISRGCVVTTSVFPASKCTQPDSGVGRRVLACVEPRQLGFGGQVAGRRAEVGPALPHGVLHEKHLHDRPSWPGRVAGYDSG